MSDLVSTALLEMQGALLARSLYPAQHPRISTCELRARDLLRDCLTQRAEITVFALEDRVVLHDQVLPASATLLEGLFRHLRRRGVDRLTIRRGIDADEIRCFLDAIAAGESADGTLAASAHVSYGYIDQPAQAVIAATPTTTTGAEPGEYGGGELPSTLRGIWEDIGSASRLDADLLGDVVSTISRTITDSVDALLPLAPLKMHDEYTFVHTINVAMLSTALSEAVGFTGRDAHDLSLAALLHDVGKQAIPRELLNKTGRFTDEEFRLVQLHPVEGARLLLATPGVPDVAPIVAYEHHVRRDGSGYPRLPQNWRLSMASRIVQVADVFDALRTHRPYRPAMALPQILEIMRKDVGVFFDADLLDVFFTQVISRGLPEPVALAS